MAVIILCCCRAVWWVEQTQNNPGVWKLSQFYQKYPVAIQQ